MIREFIDLSSAPPKLVRVEVPFANAFKLQRDETSTTEEAGSHDEACRLYLELVGRLIDDGFHELGPWLTFAKGEETIELRPPATATLQIRRGGQIEEQSFDSIVDAIVHYNEFVVARQDEGFCFALPSFDLDSERVPKEFEPQLSYEEGSDDTVRKRWYQHRENEKNQFAQELWHKEGLPWIYQFQLYAEPEGPSIQVNEGKTLRAVQTFHKGEKFGPRFMFTEDGLIEELVIHVGANKAWAALYFQDGRPTDALTFDPPGTKKGEVRYNDAGEIRKSVHYDREGRKTGTLILVNDENRIEQKFSAPGECESITWYRLDGSIEMRHVFEGEVLVLKEFFDDDGNPEQRRVRHKNRLGWDMLLFHPGGQQCSERGILDNDEYQHGEFLRFDEDGAPAGSTWWIHGEEWEWDEAPQLGWCFQRENGQVTGARFLRSTFPFQDPSTVGLDIQVEHNFDPSDFGASAEGDFSANLKQAVALASGEASREAFLQLCKLLESAYAFDAERSVSEWIPEVEAHLKQWDDALKMAPWLWINRLITAALPVEALHIPSALSLTAAMGGHFLRTPSYPLLLAWLREYPEDGPRLSGVSMSFRREVGHAIEAAQKEEPESRFHASSTDFDETFHLGDDDLATILQSPLFDGVRVLDASWSSTNADFDSDHQGILDGRGLRAGDFGQARCSSELRVLDLSGQCTRASDQFGGTEASTFPALESLNIGGGHPIGSETAKRLSESCPGLQELELRPGPAGQILEGYDFKEEEEGQGRDSVYGRLREHWGISDNTHVKTMLLDEDGAKALAKLPLKRITVPPQQAGLDFGHGVEVESLGPSESSDNTRVAAWENYYRV